MYFFIAFILLYYFNPVKIPYTAKKIIRLVAQVPKNLLYFIKLFFAYGQNRTKKSKKMKFKELPKFWKIWKADGT